MSPHQRELSALASAVKSRRIRSALAAAAGSAMVVFFQRFAALPHFAHFEWKAGRQQDFAHNAAHGR